MNAEEIALGIEAEAAIASRPGQLARLEALAREVRALGDVVDRARYWATRNVVVADGRTVALDILDQAPNETALS